MVAAAKPITDYSCLLLLWNSCVCSSPMYTVYTVFMCIHIHNMCRLNKVDKTYSIFMEYTFRMQFFFLCIRLCYRCRLKSTGPYCTLSASDFICGISIVACLTKEVFSPKSFSHEAPYVFIQSAHGSITWNCRASLCYLTGSVHKAQWGTF